MNYFELLVLYMIIIILCPSLDNALKKHACIYKTVKVEIQTIHLYVVQSDEQQVFKRKDVLPP
jgi:hypothetical protein